MEFTENQKKGFYFLERGIKKIFPFIKSIEIVENQFNSYFLYFTIEVDFLKFLEFNKVEMSEYHQKYGLKNAKKFFDDYGTTMFLFTLVSKEYEDSFSTKYNKKIEYSLNNLYQSFPNEFILTYENIFSHKNEPKEIRIEDYKIYVDQKDIERDEIERLKKIEDELGL